MACRCRLATSTPDIRSALRTSFGIDAVRPVLLVEIQALVADSGSNYPKRLAQGVDQNRLALLLAVLMRHGSVELI